MQISNLSLEIANVFGARQATLALMTEHRDFRLLYSPLAFEKAK
jgi:hypothetical protein